MSDAVADRRKRFRELHARAGLFVMPNPWDVGSARLLESHRFRGARDHERGARLVDRQAGSAGDPRRAGRACRRHLGARPSSRSTSTVSAATRTIQADRGDGAHARGSRSRGFLDRGLRPGERQHRLPRSRSRARRHRGRGSARLPRASRSHRAGGEPHPRRRRSRRHDRPPGRVSRCRRGRRVRARPRRTSIGSRLWSTRWDPGQRSRPSDRADHRRARVRRRAAGSRPEASWPVPPTARSRPGLRSYSPKAHRGMRSSRDALRAALR